MPHRRTPRLLALAALLLAPACSPVTGSAEGPSDVRLENTSAFTLRNVQFSSGSGAVVQVDSLVPGQRTAYATVERSYSYGYLAVTVEGERRVLQPVDYVGEEPIGPGRFTFRIAVDPVGRDLGMSLARDD